MLEHEAGDLTAIVEAGIRVEDLNARLEGHGQMLALDPPGNPTIGACIAANLSGPRRHRYGTARDLVIGVTVVLADGTIASSGGKVVKNVAGYDLGKLFCGSEGRLRPDRARGAAAAPAAGGDADAGRSGRVGRGRGREGVRRSCGAPVAPSAVDVLWPGWLAVLFEGGRRGVAEQFEIARGAGRRRARTTARSGRRPRRGRRWSQGRLLFDPGKLAETLGRLDEAVVRVGAGVAYVPEPVADPRDPVEVALAERVRAQFDPGGVLV